MEENLFVNLDDRKIDNLLFNKLVERGYVPSLEEVQATTDIFFEILYEIGMIYVDEVEGDDDGV